MQGRPQQALPEIERVQFNDIRLYLHALAYHALGQKKEADAALNELIAKYHASLRTTPPRFTLSGSSLMKHSNGWT